MKTLTSLFALSLALAGAAFAADPARPAITAVSHIAVYTTDAAKTEAFYVNDLGAVKGEDPENAKGVRYYFSTLQFVEVLPFPKDASPLNRLDHVGFLTSDAEGLRKYLSAKKIAVGRLSKGKDGSAWFDVTDPEGDKVEFVQAPAKPVAVPTNPLASHIIHVGYIVHNRALEDTLFKDVLGFRPYWAGAMKDDVPPTWISLQVPDGSDWLEYMVAGAADGKGIPPDMSQQTAGVLNHFSLGVPNIEATYTLLWNGNRLAGQKEVPKIGRDAKWQLNLYDPDGTRAEIMELHAIGKPCCSAFTATDPDK